MTKIPLGKADYFRSVPREARIRLKNRFFEGNPILSNYTGSLISRPGARYFLTLGDGTGPIRCIYSAPGAFSDAAFVISNLSLYKVTTGAVATNLGDTATGTPSNVPTMAATAFIGDGPDAVPEYLWLTDSGTLWLYAENGFAKGTLTLSANVANNDTVTIDGIVYKFTNASVDAGTPAGTGANPWLVALGGTTAASIINLFKAINNTGIGSTDYSNLLTTHTTVTASTYTATTLVVRAITAGTAGNALATTEASATASWGGATLAGGGSASLIKVPLPTGAGALCVAHINSYIIVVPVQDAEINGRYYWINPGETTIDPLDFATAERSPDAVNAAVVFSDKIWFTGDSTTEPWFPTGDADAPFQRFSGVLFDRGCWESTAIQVKDSLFVVDIDGAVFKISGGLKRVSTPDIEERIRLAIAREAAP